MISIRIYIDSYGFDFGSGDKCYTQQKLLTAIKKNHFLIMIIIICRLQKPCLPYSMYFKLSVLLEITVVKLYIV